MMFIPSETVLGKRPASPIGLDAIRQSKLLKQSPSRMDKPSTYRLLQGVSQDWILDDRPEADPIPPLSLLYHGFSQFMDSLDKSIHVDSKQRDLERNVDQFAAEMVKFYQDEDARRAKGLSALNQILGRTLMPASIGKSHTDGHCLGPHNAATCLVEFKNESAEISAIPIVKLTAYVAQSYRQAIVECGALFAGWNVPCLGITIVGKLNISGSLDGSDSSSRQAHMSLSMGLFSLGNIALPLLPLCYHAWYLGVKERTAMLFMPHFLAHWTFYAA
jgi:hypothetical protein